MRCHDGRRGKSGKSGDFDWLEWPGQFVDSLFADLGMGAGRQGRHRRRGPGRRFFGQGEVRLAVLSLLEDAPAHGYEIMKRLEERSGGMYKASAGTVYPVLQQLEDEDLVRSEEVQGKRVKARTMPSIRPSQGAWKGSGASPTSIGP
jgi:hypothetical protein